MKIAVFSTPGYDIHFLDTANKQFHHQLLYLRDNLSRATAALAAGCPAVCVFVDDISDDPTLSQLAEQGTRLIALRSAGFNNVDLPSAQKLNMTVARVPSYAPDAIAEHAVALMLTLNRNIHRATTVCAIEILT